jgi:hypothetical protein
LFSETNLSIFKGVVGIKPLSQRRNILYLGKIVEELKSERVRLDRAIAALEDSPSPSPRMVLKRMVAKNTSVAAPKPIASKGNRSGGITPEGRRRLSLAMKKRWAERRRKAS